ncbi:hypothetical protein NMY22_g8800 [Coprinellus aureogranulatus]|nr:hypothetical protein NMY22_g8800 [Coprinellus aureogranulatus]
MTDARNWGLPRQVQLLTSHVGKFKEHQAAGTLALQFWPKIHGKFFKVWKSQSREIREWKILKELVESGKLAVPTCLGGGNGAEAKRAGLDIKVPDDDEEEEGGGQRDVDAGGNKDSQGKRGGTGDDNDDLSELSSDEEDVRAANEALWPNRHQKKETNIQIPQRMASHEEWQKKRKGQITRWFYNTTAKSRQAAPNITIDFKGLFSNAVGGRALTEAQTYSKLYYEERLKDEIDGEIAAKQLAKGERIAIYGEKDAGDIEKEEAMELLKEMIESGGEKEQSPEEYARSASNHALAHHGTYRAARIQANIQPIMRWGPKAENINGAMGYVSYSRGWGESRNDLTFNSWYDDYHRRVVKPFGEFCHELFPEECRLQRAINIVDAPNLDLDALKKSGRNFGKLQTGGEIVVEKDRVLNTGRSMTVSKPVKPTVPVPTKPIEVKHRKKRRRDYSSSDEETESSSESTDTTPKRRRRRRRDNRDVDRKGKARKRASRPRESDTEDDDDDDDDDEEVEEVVVRKKKRSTKRLRYEGDSDDEIKEQVVQKKDATKKNATKKNATKKSATKKGTAKKVTKGTGKGRAKVIDDETNSESEDGNNGNNEGKVKRGNTTGSGKGPRKGPESKKERVETRVDSDQSKTVAKSRRRGSEPKEPVDEDEVEHVNEGDVDLAPDANPDNNMLDRQITPTPNQDTHPGANVNPLETPSRLPRLPTPPSFLKRRPDSNALEDPEEGGGRQKRTRRFNREPEQWVVATRTFLLDCVKKCQTWEDLVEQWYGFETQRFDRHGRVSEVTNRPHELKRWLQARKGSMPGPVPPLLDDMDEYKTRWLLWWSDLMGLEEGDSTNRVIRRAGPSGVVTILLGLAFWSPGNVKSVEWKKVVKELGACLRAD